MSSVGVRPSDDALLMEAAWTMARASTCSRLQVGAVVGRDGRSVVSGRNGALAGQPHCVHEPGDDSPCTVAEHAERNVVAFAAREGIRIGGGWLYVTHSPCWECARLVVAAGLVGVTYSVPYRSLAGLELLERNGVEVSVLPPCVS